MSTTTAPETRYPVLVPILSERYAASYRLLGLIALWGVAFMYLSYVPLFYSDIWGHVNYGQWMLEHRALPAEDPFTPLAEGVPVVCTAWGGQVLFALAERVFGAAGVSNLFAVTVFATILLLVRAYYHRSSSLVAAHAGLALAFLLILGRHAIVRPEIFGGFCLAVMLWLIARSPGWSSLPGREVEVRCWRDEPWSLWLGVPVLFACWANLHGSWIVGLAVLGCLFAGRVIEVVMHDRLSAIQNDRETWRWFLLGELAAAAVLLNPYGVELYVNVLTFGKNANLKDILEWYSLKMVDLEGLCMIGGLLALLVAWRFSKVAIKPSEALLLALFAWSVCSSIRMINWLAPIFGFALAPHLADVWRQASTRIRELDEWDALLSTRSFRTTAMCGLLVWIAFAFCPFSDFLLASKPRANAHLYAEGTPLGVTRFFRENPPKQGMVLAPQWWGDWMVWDGPKNLRVVMNTNAVHVAPRRVWKDYMALADGRPEFERTLDRYGIDTVVIHKELQPTLWTGLRKQGGWRVIYQDADAVVFGRKSVWPVKSEPAKSDATMPATDIPHAEPRETPAE
jgi:hypothetical protein